MANLVDALGSWRRAREFRRDQAARLAEREIAAKERIAEALESLAGSDDRRPTDQKGTRA